MAKPIIRWAGGKAKLAPQILAMMPERFGTLIEPFMGGAAVSLAMGNGHRIRLNDINPELVITYDQVGFRLRQVVSVLARWENSKEEYLRIRAMDWTRLTAAEIAARFIYLNKLAVKGLYRVNKSGGFNVPYDHTADKKEVIDMPTLTAAAEIFAKADITCGSFKNAMLSAEPGDVVFCDPPYVPFSKNGFVNYSATGFTEEDHKALASLVKELHENGVHVIVTNSNTPLVRELYKDFPTTEVCTRNSMNTSGSGASSYTEVIVDATIRGT